MLKCLICNKEFKHLGSHIYHAHGLLAKDYKKRFGLDYSRALITNDIKRKKQEHFNRHRNKYLKNLTNEHAFKKGTINKNRTSRESKIRYIKQLNNINNNRKKELCPICNIKYNGLDSHLYNKHRLLRADRIKEVEK